MAVAVHGNEPLQLVHESDPRLMPRTQCLCAADDGEVLGLRRQLHRDELVVGLSDMPVQRHGAKAEPWMVDRGVATTDAAESLEPPCIVGLDGGRFARDQDDVSRRTDGRLLAAHCFVHHPGVTFHDISVDEERRVLPDALFLRRLTDDRGLRERGDLDSQHGCPSVAPGHENIVLDVP